MKAHDLCPLTHSLLAAGTCSFCKSPIIDGAVVLDRAATVSDVVRWNIPAVLAAFATADDTVSALTCHQGDLFEELPIWRAALDHPDSSVRDLSDSTLTRRYADFNAADAERCEHHLQAHPNELALRLPLLGYFFLRSHQFPAERAARQRHSLWVIEHRPNSYTAGTPYCFLTPKEGEPYEEAKRLWLRHAGSAHVGARALGNAARFFTSYEKDQSERLYERAQELDPENPEWPEALGRLYSLLHVRRDSKERTPNATRALHQFERSLGLTRDELGRGIMLIHIAKAAFDAGELIRAHSAAEEMLRLAVGQPNPADILHAAHTILGRLALKEGDIEQAKRCLASAADAFVTTESIFAPGPRELWLAQELLQQGERAAVVEYLHRCGTVWQDPWHSAEIWAAAIERGDYPDFGHHRE